MLSKNDVSKLNSSHNSYLETLTPTLWEEFNLDTSFLLNMADVLELLVFDSVCLSVCVSVCLSVRPMVVRKK